MEGRISETFNVYHNCESETLALLRDIDSRFGSSAFGIAALTPGPAGIAAAAAAVAFDVAHRYWFGAFLGILSMIPVLGYLPALAKVGFSLMLLNRRLDMLIVRRLEIEVSPDLLNITRAHIGRYAGRLLSLPIKTALSQKITTILAFDNQTDVQIGNSPSR